MAGLELGRDGSLQALRWIRYPQCHRRPNNLLANKIFPLKRTDTMPLNAVLSLLLVVAMATTSLACSTPVASGEWRQLYCDATVVFRGTPVGGSSGLAMDQHGREIQSGYLSFHVQTLYKGSPSNPQNIRVSHTWTEGDPCEPGAFPDHASDYLVFATGDSYYTVDTCRHSFPWTCVPNSFKNSLPISC
ncbi:hypothetical protein PoB_001771400 [Plakobranchus ocellatus]|uniref:Uncharacterized protein n=1 Tax=Plakobranchus ocellatus TaxID=259542 RepID=A0AAV3ZB78_9GAST|nr:hypothetical protein PoB_001771400 [Plakobranchus ocellatus]